MLQNKASSKALWPSQANAATLVMCPPDHFDVTYQINPWMDLKGWAAERDSWRAKAVAEWTTLKATYEALGHTVHVMTPVKGLPDMVFMANCAAVLDGKAVLANFRNAERQGEEPHYAAYFSALRQQGLIHTVTGLPKDMAFEGCGDALWDVHRQMFWIGHSQRTCFDATTHVSKVFDVETIALEMVSDRFYHLDVALAPLSGGEVVYMPEAFSAEGRETLKRRIGEDKLIEATPQDADLFAVNLVNLGKDIVLSGASKPLEAALRDAGYQLHFVATDAFQLAGGSIFCLTQRLDHKRL